MVVVAVRLILHTLSEGLGTIIASQNSVLQCCIATLSHIYSQCKLFEDSVSAGCSNAAYQQGPWHYNCQ